MFNMLIHLNLRDFNDSASKDRLWLSTLCKTQCVTNHNSLFVKGISIQVRHTVKCAHFRPRQLDVWL